MLSFHGEYEYRLFWVSDPRRSRRCGLRRRRRLRSLVLLCRLPTSGGRSVERTLRYIERNEKSQSAKRMYARMGLWRRVVFYV